MAENTGSSGAVRDDAIICRYMDVARLVSMLDTRMVWFSKAATFRDDPWEGFCKATPFRNAPDDQSPKLLTHEHDGEKTEMSIPQMYEILSRSSAETCERAREHLYVNSWCLGQESMAMWEIYGSRGRGVAVTSSVAQYRRAAKFAIPNSQYTFGEVRYHDDIESAEAIRRDFSAGEIPVGSGLWPHVLGLGFHKRSGYSYECEWRCALYQDARPEPGVHIAFNLDELINAVYIGPRAEQFVIDAVSSIMQKFSLPKSVVRSTLLTPPRREAATISEK